MYTCTECGRNYSSQNSLTRHAHNHRKTTQHVCSICDVVFYRCDLLSRHMGLHKYRQIGQPSNDSSLSRGNTHGSRKRCHTACIRCRELRTKCNGQRPCLSCTNAGKECEYSWRTNRISHFSLTAEESAPVGERQTSIQPSSPAPSSNKQLQQDFISAGPQVDTDISSNSVHVDGATEQGANVLSVPSADRISSYLTQESFLGGLEMMWMNNTTHDTAWPWMHENLFLQNDALSFWPQSDASNMDYTENALPDPISISQPGRQHFPSHEWQTPSGSSNEMGFHQSCRPGFTSQDIPFQSIPVTAITQSVAVTQPVADNCEIEVPRPSHQLEEPKRSEDITTPQVQVVKALIAYASKSKWRPESRASRAAFWRSISPKVVAAFDIGSQQTNSETHILGNFLELYLKHFGPLWPLLSLQNLDNDSLHPLLYLVLTSIGAMYGGVAQSSYGAMMHNHVCKTLTRAIELEDSDDDFLWLCQARLLTQVAALYLGQAKAFSYAQHLGGLLVAQARRMDLFSAVNVQRSLKSFKFSGESRPDAERLTIWLHLEARRRLAFGIFRADTYTSVLLNIKPLVSLEEIDLNPPACDSIWRGERLPPHLCLQIIEQDRTLGRHLQFSDIYRVAMDRNEPLPALEPVGYELLLFGLQPQVWRFSRDPQMFQRLTGKDRETSAEESQEISISANSTRGFETSRPFAERARSERRTPSLSEADHLDEPSRQMADLQQECDRLMAALQKWKRSLPFLRTLIQSDRDRGSLLSSLMLYHLSYLRLYAPIGDLHQIQYLLADDRPVENDLVESVCKWANTTQANLAAEHACTIWSLITKESCRPETVRAKSNLLAFTGLHHGAVVLWSYAGAHDPTHDEKENLSLTLDYPSDSQPSIPIHRSQTKSLLMSFVRLYDLISPGRWSSFAKAAVKLSHQQFPLPDGQRIP